MSELSYVIDIVNLRKTFRRKSGRGGYSTLKSAFVGLFDRRPDTTQYVTEALKDITLRIPRGASVGVIGRNGSGKSTLLKLITGIYKPDSGTVKIAGRVSALIELGAGFHPEFTGRENLFLSGVLHGLTRKQLDSKFDEIVDFAELRDVIDEPVRTYSSGMFMRLGFSVAVHTDPDVLLVDEVLAVGDAGFVAKCKDKVAELHSQGKTLLLVTHDLDAVERWCNEALWLHGGEIKDRGYPRRVIDRYRNFIEKNEEDVLFEESVPAKAAEDIELPGQRARWGSRELEIVSVELLSRGEPHRVFHPESPVQVRIEYLLHAVQNDYVFGVGINRTDGLPVFGTNTSIERITLPTLRPSGFVTVTIPRLGLLDASYTLDVAAHRSDGYPFDYHKEVIAFSVRSPVARVGVVFPSHSWSVDGVEVVVCNS